MLKKMNEFFTSYFKIILILFFIIFAYQLYIIGENLDWIAGEIGNVAKQIEYHS